MNVQQLRAILDALMQRGYYNAEVEVFDCNGAITDVRGFTVIHKSKKGQSVQLLGAGDV